MSVRRASLLATAMLAPLVGLSSPSQAQSDGHKHHPRHVTAHHGRRVARRAAAANATSAGTISAIKVVGNQRIEDGTVLSYVLLQPGDQFDAEREDRSLKTLYATGLFKDVSLTHDGGTLVVKVTENPIIDRIVFEGNHAIKDDAMKSEVRLRARAVFTPEMAQADRQRILDLYAKKGKYSATVDVRLIRLKENRVDVVFEIAEGPSTYISKIAFVGNQAFSEGTLGEVITSREERYWRFLSSSDQYNPERIKFDKELLRRFYLKHGYVDFHVDNATAELSPDRKAFFVTFNLHEGAQYTVGKLNVVSHMQGVKAEDLQGIVDEESGDIYDGQAMDTTAQAMEDKVRKMGFPFVEAHVHTNTNVKTHVVDVTFDITEAPRVYVERIDITGNTRTEDKVIRREFEMAEGDPFNAAALHKTKQRLDDLGFFSNTSVTPSEGSAPDRTVITANVDEKSTGELTLGGGYSTYSGALVNAGIREHNLVGTGIDAGLTGVLAQYESQIDLSVTDPYFLDRNLVAGSDFFHSANDNYTIASYNETRDGLSLRTGYQFNDHLSQAWSYSLIDRDVNSIQSGASLFVLNEAGSSLLSQVGQTLSLDYRDSRTDPHTGWILRLSTDYAGLGGDVNYERTKLQGEYFLPLDSWTGNSDWGFSFTGSVGYLADLGGKSRIIDRFFLGGDNLRGFLDGGAGPHSIPINGTNYTESDSLGGNFMYTESTELHFPLPISPDLGISGRAFVDVGGLSGVSSSVMIPGTNTAAPYTNSSTPRVGAGVGISWKTPFGLINLDLADPVVKQQYDQTQVFRFGFGTRF